MALMNGLKVIGGIALIFMMLLSYTPLVDELTALASGSTDTFIIALSNVFPPLYAVMILSATVATIIWVWKG